MTFHHSQRAILHNGKSQFFRKTQQSNMWMACFYQYTMQKLTELSEEINKLTITVEEFKTFLSIIDKATK